MKGASVVALDAFEGEEVWVKEEFLWAGELPAAKLRDAFESFAILHSDRAIFSPHNAFNTREALERILATSIEKVRTFFAGTYQVPATPTGARDA
ncbi:MAG TPA: hypothetical protein PKK74_05605 [Candidatus Methanoculleus thermohydrogenotrophicum]|nr:hypothetical protein [Candidatus Methanoculleus thermohydrogenotrophicum]HOB18149.1 hypothetical protein [Candidatus Methanoculleus thermohydrogenotrophicum]HPZ37789.1 hypothetical protein [Candidatus Methanoculleus thermohydrogenotrophicum]HQC91553.1 hypothetical protein [Candidatus Methanoculleus thermohydrogenotrophicum]